MNARIRKVKFVKYIYLKMRIILTKSINKHFISCLSYMINNNIRMKFTGPLSVVVLLVPFSFFILFGVLDQRMMPKLLRMPLPYSVIPLYPSRVPLLDLKQFTYVLNNDVCEGENKNIFAVVIVHSHPANRHTRDVMRRNIPREDLDDIGVRRVFLLARAEWDDQEKYVRTPQDQIGEENLIHQDIIQGNFKEHYHNLTYKHIMGLQWVNTFCPRAKFIIKMDDDIVVDLYHLRDILKYRYENRKNLILGLLSVEPRVIRDPKSKWYVKKSEYKPDHYPNFVSGWVYAMSSDSAIKIINASRRFPYFWIDDVHVTGTLAEYVGVKREGINEYFTPVRRYLQCCLEVPMHTEYLCDFIAGPTEGDVDLMEKLLRHARSCYVQPCLKRPKELRLTKTCVIKENPDSPLGKGHGEVIKVY